MGINVSPLPPANDLGIGFWQELLDRIATAKAVLEENNASEDSHDASSDSLEVDNTFDPTVNTVAEFEAAITEIIGALSAVV